MVTALGVPTDSSGVGLDPLTHRRIIASRWASPGVITGLQVRGHPSLPGKYVVWRGAAVVDGGADGATELYLDDTSTESTVTVGDSAYDRIDRVFLRVGTTPTDNRVHVDVLAGVPAASPTPPGLPAGCLRLADMRLPAGATSMASASRVGDIDYAIPYGAGLGRLGLYEDTRTDVDGDPTVRKWFQNCFVRFYVPTDRIVELVHDSDVSYLGAGAGDWMSWASTFMLDGQDVPCSSRETLCMNSVWVHHHNSRVLQVGKGDHTVCIRYGIALKTGNGRPHFHYGESNGLTYPGRTVEVWDRGTAQ